MWNSNGDLDHATSEVVDTGPMTVSGKIDGNSRVRLVCTGGPITVNGDIQGNSVVYLVATGPITMNGKIDGSAVVVLVSTGGAITVTGKVDGSSNVTFEAAGDVTIGTQGGDGDKKIDGSSSVTAIAGGNITLGSYIHAATVDFRAHGMISTTEIDTGANVQALADGDVTIAGKVDGGSRVELVSNRMSVTVNGKIDGSSMAFLTAGLDVGIGVGKQGGDEDHKIDGNSSVVAIASRDITLGSRIAKDHTSVDFAAGGTVTIDGQIGYDAQVRLLSADREDRHHRRPRRRRHHRPDRTEGSGEPQGRRRRPVDRDRLGGSRLVHSEPRSRRILVAELAPYVRVRGAVPRRAALTCRPRDRSPGDRRPGDRHPRRTGLAPGQGGGRRMVVHRCVLAVPDRGGSRSGIPGGARSVATPGPARPALGPQRPIPHPDGPRARDGRAQRDLLDHL